MPVRPEHAFFDAIRESPDDDAPRLIYADWLDEQGAPDQAALAAFIRTQCALAALAWSDPAAITLRLQSAALEAEFAGRWTEWLRPLGIDEPVFERGLVVGLTIDADNFLDNADALRTCCPAWREATLRLAGRSLVEALDCSAIEELQGLTLESENLGDDGARDLARSPRLKRLARLALRSCWIGDEGLAELANSPHLARLAKLDLAMNDFGAAGISALVESPAFAELKTLGLRSVKQLDDDALEHLAACARPSH